MSKLDNSEKGAAMLEFAIVAGILFMILLFLIDTLNIYYRTQILADTVNRAARVYAINRVAGPGGAQLDVAAAATAYIQAQYGFGAGNIIINATQANTGGRCTLQVSALWTGNSCISCQIMNVQPQAFAEAVIEDECVC